MMDITEDSDIQPLLDLVNSPELLDEGIISAIKGKVLNMFVNVLSEKHLNTVINKSFTKAMSKAKDVETKKLLMEKRNEFLSLDKKAKKDKLKEYLKKAPEKDRAAAELKFRNELKKTKNIKESVLFEMDKDNDGIISKAELDAANAANLAAYRSQAVTTTRGEMDDMVSTIAGKDKTITDLTNKNSSLAADYEGKLKKANADNLATLKSKDDAHAAELEAKNTEISDIQAQLRTARVIAIGMGILIAILVVVIIALLVRNAQLA